MQYVKLKYMTNEQSKQQFEEYLLSKYVNVYKEHMLNKIFETKRKFRADYYVEDINSIIEINGGQWSLLK